MREKEIDFWRESFNLLTRARWFSSGFAFFFEKAKEREREGGITTNIYSFLLLKIIPKQTVQAFQIYI